MIWHLGSKSLQLKHALRLQILNRIIERPVLRLQCGPGYENVFQYFQDETRLPIKSGSGERHEQL
jgi:hypothetical protein